MTSFTMLTSILEWADWDIPPPQMKCTVTFKELIEDVERLSREISSHLSALNDIDAQKASSLLDRAIRFYVRVPAIVNVMLNYKICVEHGLPLHPTVYYELKEARKYRISHTLGEIQHANELYWKSIQIARDCFRLEPSISSVLQHYTAELPDSILSFIYTSVQDQYTWRGSRPALLSSLAQKAKTDYSPEIIVAAAHGSIMPALILSEMLEIPLYFIRFSMFKRNDEEPILSLSDQAWLFDFRDAKALIFDEDVAGGRTLEMFRNRLAPLFGSVKTACSIRHAGASIHPDFSGKTWWE